MPPELETNLKYTRHTLNKIETLIKENNFTILYEKGNFQSGYCILEHKRVAVVNRFFDVEARINCLLEIMESIVFLPEHMSESSLKFYTKTLGRSIDAELPLI